MTLDEQVANKLGTEVKPYSTKIQPAWEIVEKFEDFSLEKRTEEGGSVFWRFEILGDDGAGDDSAVLQEAVADTAPMAICRAFLKLDNIENVNYNPKL